MRVNSTKIIAVGHGTCAANTGNTANKLGSTSDVSYIAAIGNSGVITIMA